MNYFSRFCFFLCFASLVHLAQAQTDKKVYTYVEQMPHLPGTEAPGAIQAAILKNFKYPADALRNNAQGTIYLRFNVTETGNVADAQVLKGLTPSTDAAALDAVRRLPTFVPGKQNGKPVTVAFTIPLRLQQPGTVATVTVKGNADVTDLSGLGNEKVVEEVVGNKVYTYVEQMPALPGGGGHPAIVAALQKEVMLPANEPEGRVFTSFTVDAQGKVTDAKIVKGLSPATDAAVLAAVKKLPTFIPGKQNGRAVAVSYTVPVTLVSPNHVYEVREVATRARFPQPGLYPYLQRNLRVPAVVGQEKLRGLVGVDFVVLPSGKIDAPALTSHLCSSCDDEVMRVVRSFPAWVPARDHAGKAVAVRQHLDLPMPLPAVPTPQVPYVKPEKVYSYASQMPTLLDGTPVNELGALLTQTIRYSETARREKITGRAGLDLIIDEQGIVRLPRITQSVCNSCDQAILEAVAALGPFVPGRQADQPVPVELHLTVPFAPGGSEGTVK